MPDTVEIKSNKVNGWNEWSRFVLKELERLNRCYEKLDGKIDKLSERQVLVRVKTAGIGAAVSLIVTIVTILIATAIKGS